MARDHAYEGGFAGAVRSNYAADRASIEREVDIVIGDQAANRLVSASVRSNSLTAAVPRLAAERATDRAREPAFEADNHHYEDDADHELPIFGNDGAEVV